MNTTNRKPQIATMKPVTTKLSAIEFSQLVEQAEMERTTVSAVIRTAIQQRSETIELHKELDKLRSLQEQFMFDLLCEVHNIPPSEMHGIRENIKKKMQERNHEQR